MLLPEEASPWHPPMVDPATQRSQLELSEGEDELRILRETYVMVLNQSGKRAYAYQDNGWKYRVEEYLAHRDAFFGSLAKYSTYKQTAQTELDDNKEKLRGRIEPPLERRPTLRNWREAQVSFYAWTRRAYENVVPAGTNIPALINAGNSKKLEEALKKVRADYGKPFKAGGFNPRPIKTPDGYRLGTISDHALGEAIDIRAPTNAQIEAKQWEQILNFTGKQLDTATRKAKWKTAPQELHTAIVEINTQFVTRLEAAVAKEAAKLAAAKPAAGAEPAAKETAKEAAAKAAKAAAKSDADALAAAIKADPHLTKLGAKFIERWRRGFFDLPWDLVKELHEEAFIWGAVFGRLDLHHFELP
jgi:hypothetical protein